MKYLKYFENINTDNIDNTENHIIKIDQTWKSLKDSRIVTVIRVDNEQNKVSIYSYDNSKTDKRTMMNIKDFLESYELIENIFNDIELKFKSSIYLEDRSIVGCYFITKEEAKFIEILNVLEYREEGSIYQDEAIPFTIDIKKTKLPKSQIEILKEDEHRKGFFYIKIPYWLYKKNSEELKIKRIGTDLKRLSMKSNDMIKLADDLQDPDVIKYFKNGYFDNKTSTNLIQYYKDNSIRLKLQRNRDIEEMRIKRSN